tara:strand:+ start:9933 stop:10916 length:984 start_codon:yes stop_codon:yes gene_type:complete
MVDNQEVLKSSTSTETEDGLEEQNQDVQSSSTESETEDDLLSVVQNAIDPKESEETESQSDNKEETEQDVEPDSTQETEENPPPAAAEESLDNVPLHLQPRFKEVIAEKNSYKHGHEQYSKIQNYLKEMKLTAEETAQGLTIMGLMKNDPRQALEQLKPIMDNLQIATGERLPDDIKQKVEEGYLDEESAQELSMSRAEAINAKNQNQQLVNEQQEMAKQDQLDEIGNAVTAWEENARQNDPDFDLKQDEVDDRVSALVREYGRPSTIEQATEMAQTALDQVNDRYTKRNSNKKPIRSLSGGKLGGSPVPEPKSLLEAVQNAMASGS